MDTDSIEYCVALLLLAGIEADGEVSDEEIDRIYEVSAEKIEKVLDIPVDMLKNAVNRAMRVFSSDDNEEIDEQINDAIETLGERLTNREKRKMRRIVKDAMAADGVSRGEKDFLRFLEDVWSRDFGDEDWVDDGYW